MHRIDTPTAQKDKFGAGKNGFTRGNPQTGVPATDLDDDYFDTLQEELAAIVEAAGDTLNKAQRNQVLIAAQKLFAPANATITALAALVGAANKVPYFTGANAATLTDLTSVGRQIIGKATIAEVLTYLGLKEAAKRDVGTGANQIPDMNSFASGSSGAGQWIRLPSGTLIQWGIITNTLTTGGYNVTYPTPFSESPSFSLSVTASTPILATAINTTVTALNGVNTWNLQGSRQTNSVSWMAIGK